MKSLITSAPYITDPENYSDLQVCQSAAGYYIGTMYKDPETSWEEPGSRDSDYYKTRKEAEDALTAIENDADDAPILRAHP